jgi:hypothetical protein
MRGPVIRASKIRGTRLELKWRPPTDEDGDLVCEYNLVLALAKHDIRREAWKNGRLLAKRQTEKVIALGKTIQSGVNSAFYGDGSIREPIRDSAHAVWDSKKLGGIPVFLVFNGLAQAYDRNQASEE